MLHWMQGNQIFEATIVNGLPGPIGFWQTHPCKWNRILEYPVKVFGRAKTLRLEAVFRWNQHSWSLIFLDHHRRASGCMDALFQKGQSSQENNKKYFLRPDATLGSKRSTCFGENLLGNVAIWWKVLKWEFGEFWGSVEEEGETGPFLPSQELLQLQEFFSLPVAQWVAIQDILELKRLRSDPKCWHHPTNLNLVRQVPAPNGLFHSQPVSPLRSDV